MTYLDVLTHFVSRADLENYGADYSDIGNMTVIGPVVFDLQYYGKCIHNL